MEKEYCAICNPSDCLIDGICGPCKLHVDNAYLILQKTKEDYNNVRLLF